MVLVVNYEQLAMANQKDNRQVNNMTLKEAQEGKEYLIKNINTDEELNSFLFTLGCYSGQPITVVSHRSQGCVISVKDARYNIDYNLAQAIEI